MWNSFTPWYFCSIHAWWMACFSVQQTQYTISHMFSASCWDISLLLITSKMTNGLFAVQYDVQNNEHCQHGKQFEVQERTATGPWWSKCLTDAILSIVHKLCEIYAEKRTNHAFPSSDAHNQVNWGYIQGMHNSQWTWDNNWMEYQFENWDSSCRTTWPYCFPCWQCSLFWTSYWTAKRPSVIFDEISNKEISQLEAENIWDVVYWVCCTEKHAIHQARIEQNNSLQEYVDTSFNQVVNIIKIYCMYIMTL